MPKNPICFFAKFTWIASCDFSGLLPFILTIDSLWYLQTLNDLIRFLFLLTCISLFWSPSVLSYLPNIKGRLEQFYKDNVLYVYWYISWSSSFTFGQNKNLSVHLKCSSPLLLFRALHWSSRMVCLRSWEGYLLGSFSFVAYQKAYF